MGAAGMWTIDGGRGWLENLPAVAYLAASYYKRWFLGLERRVVAHGLVGEDEIAAGHALRPGIRLNRKLTPTMRKQRFTRISTGPPPPPPASRSPPQTPPGTPIRR